MLRKSAFFLLLVSLVFSHDYVRPDECPDDHISYDRSPGQTGKTFLVDDEYDCSAACDEDGDCVAYNIEKGEAQGCELNEQRAGKYGEFLNTGLGWQFYEKQDTEREYDSCTGIEDRASFAGRLPNNTDGMQKEILDSGVLTEHVNRGSQRSWWGKDTKRDDDLVYRTEADYNDAYYVWEHPDMASFIANTNAVRHDIDPHGISSQYIVHDRKFWYRWADQKDVVVWDLDIDEQAGLVTDTYAYKWFYGPYSSQCQMDCGQHAGLDIEADESGLWFIFGIPNFRCYTVIVKIDTDNYRFTEFYKVLPWQFSLVGTGWIMDGIYYATEHYNHDPTFIRYQYNIRNDTFVMRYRIDSGKRWEQTHGINAQTHYNPVDGKIYATNNHRHFTIEPSIQYIFNYN